MSRDDLVDATYDAAETLNTLKLQYGRIDALRGMEVANRTTRARALETRLSMNNTTKFDPATFQMLQGEIIEFSVSTGCDKRELFWRRHIMNFKWLGILRVIMSLNGKVPTDRACVIDCLVSHNSQRK